MLQCYHQQSLFHQGHEIFADLGQAGQCAEHQEGNDEVMGCGCGESEPSVKKLRRDGRVLAPWSQMVAGQGWGQFVSE